MVKVVLHTEQHPEDNAMLQALYSRSAESVTDHIEKLRTVGSGKFMSQYYLGYGHASIGDCGFITIYIEGVSMLAAKAIQDDYLYNGQESSSRYIDWSNQPFINPYAGENSEREKDFSYLLNCYREFYVKAKPILIEHLTSLYPLKPDEKKTVYEKAIAAKAFDILRGYLPCGSSTNVAWTTSLRKANERLASLALHPLKEVRDIAELMHKQAITAYPNSIGPLPSYQDSDPYLKGYDNYYVANAANGFNSFQVAKTKLVSMGSYGRFGGDFERVADPSSLKRPYKAKFAKHDPVSRHRIEVKSSIDFGSFRDIQRHRGNYCAMPMVLSQSGFHPWYYDNLPEQLKRDAQILFTEITALANEYCSDDEDNESELLFQYALPMGTMVHLHLDADIPQAIYLAELRSSQTVHATLRPIAQAIGEFLEGIGIKTYTDYSEDEWNIRRGNQDITKK